MAASPTTWHPRTNFTPKSWLLTDGSMIQEPALEETASGRKVRIAGTNISAFSKDMDNLIYEGVKSIAKDKGLKVWMAHDPKQYTLAEEAHFERRLRKGKQPVLHLLDNTQSYGESYSTIWFRFRHQSLPVEAALVVQLRTKSWGARRNGETHLDVVLLQPNTHPDYAATVEAVLVNDVEFDAFKTRQRDYSKRQTITDLLINNTPAWIKDVPLSSEQTQNDRHAVKKMRDVLREADGLQTIQILDLRDDLNPAWLDLDLYDTNLTGEFTQSLSDFLDGSGVVAEIKSHYDEIRRLFRSTGIVLDAKDENDWARALAGGEPVTVDVQTSPNEVNGQSDNSHNVTLHLPTGTIIVGCSARGSTKDEIAHAWDEAQTLASLTGQEDALLAYARKYAATANERRTQQIIEERKVDD